MKLDMGHWVLILIVAGLAYYLYKNMGSVTGS